MPQGTGSAPLLIGSTLPIGTRLGEFEITGTVGEGGFGIVYVAHDHSLGRQVALKEYMPAALAVRTGAVTVSVRSARHADTFDAGLKSFINEARLLAQFDHPSLVKVYRFWVANGTAYMVMPLYEGITLKKALGRMDGPPDENWLKDLLRPLLDALAQIHGEQCFHRDIAPDNILILGDGRPVLLDFGAARRVIGDMTQALTVILKPGYAPIEQYAEIPDLKQGAWTDLYAVAAVVYFAVTGKPPVASVSRVVSDTLLPLNQVAFGRYSEQFLRAVDRALSVRPEQRPQNVAAMRALLGLSNRRQRPRAQVPGVLPDAKPNDTPTVTRSAATTVNPSVLSPPPRPPENVAPAPRRRSFPIYAIGVVLVVAVAGGAAFFVARHDSRPDAAQAPIPQSGKILRQPEGPIVAGKNEKGPVTGVEPPPVSTTQLGPTPRKPFTADLMLDEILVGRNRDHTVTATAEKSEVHIDRDALHFAITSSKAGYIYLIEINPDRSRFRLLFPNALDSNNHVVPGKAVMLPRSNWSLKATGSAGVSRFVAMVSDEQRDFADLQPMRDGIYNRFPLDVGAELYMRSPGPQSLFSGQKICAAGRACSDSYGAAGFSVTAIAGLPEAGEAAPPKAIDAARTSPGRAAIPATSNFSPKMEKDKRDNRCSDILQRASLGESLTGEEQAILKEKCR